MEILGNSIYFYAIAFFDIIEYNNIDNKTKLIRRYIIYGRTN